MSLVPTTVNDTIYDVVGIGIGPFNLGLACLLDKCTGLKTAFFDRKPSFDWHTGIMPEWTTLQIPFIADLVTFADPTNRFSVLNYLKESGRLHQFYIHENFYLSRAEYNKYCQWAVSKHNSLYFGKQVENIQFDYEQQCYQIDIVDTKTRKGEQCYAKKLVIGTGTQAITPSFFTHGQEGLYLSSDYMHIKEAMQAKTSITVVGAGQSGAEVFFDLLRESSQHAYTLQWIGRPNNFFAMDLNKLALELTSPDYKNFFSNLTQEVRAKVLKEQSLLYKGINRALLNRIYDYLYLHHERCSEMVNILPGLDIQGCSKVDNQWQLLATSQLSKKSYRLGSDAVVFALGYQYEEPKFFNGLAELIRRDEVGNLLIDDDYVIDVNETIFVQNVGLEKHGIVTPDLGMGPYRNSIIANKLLGIDYFKVETKTTYQKFL